MENNKVYQIPRVIHYFWLGRTEKPESVKKCISSWRKQCPDFEIREWNESNYDISKHPYMEKAYREKRWAFISDYGRLDVLYQYGGIYLDTDVEVLKDLSPLCEYKAFKGFENPNLVNNGQGFGCVAGMPIFKEMMQCYDGNEPYYYENGEEHYVTSPNICTKVLVRHGLRLDGTKQRIEEIDIFPKDYFCPLDFYTGKLNVTKNTYSIHYFDASWKGKNAQEYHRIMRRFNRMFGLDKGMTLFGKIMSLKDNVKRFFRKIKDNMRSLNE